ncbi:branched-chain amino acid ABC transporter permease [Streptomyces sp. MBT49]|uniref:branched-chain amino acid ABC transporter permease n=1 Tax=Streptomyces sp. MBT49 TaxID=1488380 RepID=UPI001F37C385|nr:branched-chain amino acid ABC transporter permease [Streptomyces sp. MBT49]
MTAFLDSVLTGLALGAVYALVALGFVVIFKASGVLNFAHGSLLLFGGYLIAVLHDDLGFAGALAVSVLATAALAGALDRLLLQRGDPDPQAAHVQTIVTIGVDIVLLTDLSRRIGGDLLTLGDPWGDSVTRLGPVTVADSRLAAIAVSALAIAAVFTLFRRTSWGLALRAAGRRPGRRAARTAAGRPPGRGRPAAVRAALLPGRLLAAHRPVLDGRGDRRRRPRPAHRHRGPALAGPRLLPRGGRLRLHLAGGRTGPRPADPDRRPPRRPPRRGGDPAPGGPRAACCADAPGGPSRPCATARRPRR